MHLPDYQALLLDQLRHFGEQDYATQFHPDLSPAGWHLGHCIYTETFWIREQWLGMETLDEQLKHLFVPELSHKTLRGERMAPYSALLEWSRRLQTENLSLIDRHADIADDHQLMADGYLLRFLQQHYAQHFETVQMVRVQQQCRTNDAQRAVSPVSTDTGEPEYVFIDAGKFRIGSDSYWHYDNEKPLFKTRLDAFCISRSPVTNSQFRAFIADDGYKRPELWSEGGWQWNRSNAAEFPENWLNGNGIQSMTPDGTEPLQDDAAVMGINYYEASAFARWAGARLPHEYEWETAARAGLLDGVGQSWEWCANTLHPYPGFRAWPYDGYSMPYFDDRHYVLRGGSRYTQGIIKRPTFRNYYEADKRHVFAGLRLVKDPD